MSLRRSSSMKLSWRANWKHRKHLARTVHDLYFKPKYEEFQPRTIWSLSKCFHVGIQRIRADFPIQGDCQAGRVSGDEVLAIVLSMTAVSAGPPLVWLLAFF